MKLVSSQPLLCVLLFVAGCLCFLAGLNSSWLTDEYDGAPAGGGRLPGLEPRKPVEPVKPPEPGDGDQAVPKDGDKKDAADPEHPEGADGRKAGKPSRPSFHDSYNGTR